MLLWVSRKQSNIREARYVINIIDLPEGKLITPLWVDTFLLWSMHYKKSSRNRLKFVLVTRLGGNQVDAGTRELQEASEGFTGDPDWPLQLLKCDFLHCPRATTVRIFFSKLNGFCRFLLFRPLKVALFFQVGLKGPKNNFQETHSHFSFKTFELY